MLNHRLLPWLLLYRRKRLPFQLPAVRMGYLLIATGIVLVLPGKNTAYAATYYVAPDGKAENPGTKSQPWTLSRALEAVSPGDTINLRGGTYKGSALWLRRSGAPGQWITFRAHEGEVPIIEGPGPGNAPKTSGVTDVAPISYVRIEGLWVTGWHYTGIGIGWNNPCHDIEFRYNVADLNGQSGLGCLKVERCKIEYNIASRNGFGPDSWSSGINFYEVKGSDNVARGNVAFNNIDTSNHHTDGGGFILDLSKDFGNALFENNIAFNNGGACIIATDTSGIRLVNNTCWHNGQDTSLRYNAAEYHFSDTRRDGNDYSLKGVSMVNNVAVAAPGHKAQSHDKGFQNSRFEGNYLYPDTKSVMEVYRDPQQADFRPQAKAPLIGIGVSSTAPPLDIGFDPKCVKRQTVGQKYDWWKYAPDLDYIRRIGGTKSCFQPQSRSHEAAATIGAYRFETDKREPVVPGIPTRVKVKVRQ